MGRGSTDIELPSFNVLAGFLACDNHHEFGNLPPCHPLIELGHDPFYVGFDLVVRRD